MRSFTFENYGEKIIPKEDMSYGPTKPIYRFHDDLETTMNQLQSSLKELQKTFTKSLFTIEDGISYEKYYQEYVQKFEQTLSKIEQLAKVEIINKKLDRDSNL